MKTTFFPDEMTEQLEAIVEVLLVERPDNFRAWSQTQLRLKQVETWDALGDNLCRVFSVVETYFACIDRHLESVPLRERPIVLPAGELARTLRRWDDYVDGWTGSARLAWHRVKTAEMQRQVWVFLTEFPLAHEAYVKKLAALVGSEQLVRLEETVVQ